MDINSQIEIVITKYPYLKYNKKKNWLYGKIFVSKFDSYNININLNPYPELFPQVYELDERIPKKADRHIYSDSGSFCFTTQAKSQILLKTKISSINLFIENIVIPFLQNNSYFEINKKYKTEEYSHNVIGIIEGYRDILQLENDFQIARLMFNHIEGHKLNIRDLCYCGSGIKLKKCTHGLHNICYRNFRKIDKNIIRFDLIKCFLPYLKSKGLI